VKEVILNTETDPYLSQLVWLFSENLGTDTSVETILKRVEKTRQEQEKILLHGEKFSWTVVAGDFVKEKRPDKIKKYFVRWQCCRLAIEVYSQLLQALQKKNPQKELNRIIRQVLDGTETVIVPPSQSVTGFEWQNEASAQELTNKLFTGLLKLRFIHPDSSADNFQSLFGGSQIKGKIQWMESLPHLVHFFRILVRNDLKTPPAIDNYVENHQLTKAEKLQFSKWLYEKLCLGFLNQKGDEVTSGKLILAANQLVKSSKARNPGKPLLPREADLNELLRNLE
jgi:hypothetical protein